MAIRKGLIFGLLVALSAAPAPAGAAENTVGQSTTSLSANVPEIRLQRGSAPASGTPELWQRTTQSAATDIRFKKPEMPGASSHAAQSTLANPAAATALPAAASSRKPVAQLAAANSSAATTNASANLPASITNKQAALASQPAPFAALIAPPSAIPNPIATASAATPNAAPQQAVTQQSAPITLPPIQPQTPAATPSTSIAAVQPRSGSEQPLLQHSLSTPLVAQPAAQSTAQAPARAETRLTDEQLQLVTRILSDHDVVRAAQEEPLPDGPNADPLHADSDSKDDENLPAMGDEVYPGECCPPQPCLFWVGGVEATFLSPDLNNDGLSWAVDDFIAEREDVFTSEEVDSVYLTPRVWLGVQGCAWGVNLRYWHLNASESSFDPSIGKDGTWDAFDCGKRDLGFFSMSRLEAYTIDLEITRRFCLHDCWMQASVGVRHADVEYAESITGTALATEANLFGYAEADRETRGTGIVLGWYGRKALFPCSCVHWYYNLRGSALWGPTRTAVETGATVLSTDANAGSINGAYTCVDDNLFIGEVQLGLEWNYCLQCVPATAFFRTGIEYQRWTGGMGYSESGSFAGIEEDDDFSIVGSTFASAAAPELDLIGLTIGMGLTW